MCISDINLQEALMSRRPEFVSSLRQRQKRVQLAAENRRLQALVRAEQERIFADQRRVNANPDAHPYSGGCRLFICVLLCVFMFVCVCVCVCVVCVCVCVCV